MNKYSLYNINVLNYTQYNQKTNHTTNRIFKNKQNVLKYFAVYLQLKSNANNRFLFIVLLVMLEKITNVRIAYIYSSKLKKNRIKIGYFLFVRDVFLQNIVIDSYYFSFYKLYNKKIKTYRNNYLNIFILYKILFFSIFNTDLDYYDFFDIITNYADNHNFYLKYHIHTIQQTHYLNSLILNNIRFYNK